MRALSSLHGLRSWFRAPQYEGMAAIADFNNDRYALPQLGPERLTNGKFDSDISSWTSRSYGAGSISWDSSGKLSLNSVDGSNRGAAEQGVDVIPGKLYEIFTDANGFFNLQVTNGPNRTNGYVATYNGITGVAKSYAIAQTNKMYVYVESSSPRLIDTISVREVLCGKGITYGAETVLNRTFDSDLSNWAISASGASSAAWVSGAMALTGDGTNYVYARQTVAVTAGATCTFSFESNTSAVGLNIKNGDTNAILHNAVISTSPYTYTFVAPVANIQIEFYKQSATTVNIDNVSLREGPFGDEAPKLRNATRAEWFSAYTAPSTEARTYTAPDGSLKADLLANAARFDWSNGKRQLLLENAGTNHIRYSSGQGAVEGSPGTLPTNWSRTNNPAVDVVSSGTVNGLKYVDIRIQGLGISYAIELEAVGIIAATTGQTWTASMFVQLVGGSLSGVSSIGMALEANGTAPERTQSDFTPDGTLRRVSHTHTLATAGATSIRPRLRFNGAGTFDFTIRLGGIQIEQASFASSFIETNGAAVTRAIETFRLAPLVEAILQRSEGGVVVRAHGIRTVGGRMVGGASSVSLVHHSANAINGDRLRNYNLTSGFDVALGSGSVLAAFGAASAFDASGRALCGNGGAVASDANAIGDRSALYLGRDGSGAAYGDGRYDFLGILSTRPTNARLQQLAVPA